MSHTYEMSRAKELRASALERCEEMKRRWLDEKKRRELAEDECWMFSRRADVDNNVVAHSYAVETTEDKTIVSGVIKFNGQRKVYEEVIAMLRNGRGKVYIHNDSKHPTLYNAIISILSEKWLKHVPNG